MQKALPEQAVKDGAEGGGHRKAAGASFAHNTWKSSNRTLLNW